MRSSIAAHDAAPAPINDTIGVVVTAHLASGKGVARKFECSEVARTACRACGSDGRSVGAWTERAPNLRGREGVKNGGARAAGGAKMLRL